jgi:hypothetical protein
LDALLTIRWPTVDYGLDPWKKAAVQSLTESGAGNVMTNVFLSHSHADRAIASELAAALKMHGLNVWIDTTEIRAGDSIHERIETGLQAASYLVVLLSEHSLASKWVQREISYAYHRSDQKAQTTIIPVRIDDAPLPVEFRDINYVDIKLGVSVAAERIYDRIRSDTGKSRVAEIIDANDLAKELVPEQRLQKGPELYISSAIALMGVLATLLAAWPSFDGLFAKRARIYFEARTDIVTFPPGVDAEQIPKLLQSFKIAPAGQRIRLINKGTAAATEIKIGFTTAGKVHYVRTNPIAGSKSVWVRIPQEGVIEQERNAIVEVKDLIPDREVIIDFGYEPADAKIATDVVYDGAMAFRIASIDAAPKLSIWTEFRLPLQIFLGTLLAAVAAGIFVMALRNPRFRSMLLDALGHTVLGALWRIR